MKSFALSNPNIEKIELACLVKAGTGNNLHKNRPSHGIAIFLGGERLFTFGSGRKYTVGESTLFYFPKGSDYSIENKLYSDCYAVNFQISGDCVFEPQKLRVTDVNKYLPCFKSAVKLWNSKQRGFELKIKSELYNILYLFQEDYIGNTADRTDAIIKPALDYIQAEITGGEIYVSYLAELCRISEVYLRKLFVKRFSMSPNAYIKKLRLERAEELLLSGLYTCSQVCRMSGFADESYFSREFKRKNGITPGHYKSVNGF